MSVTKHRIILSASSTAIWGEKLHATPLTSHRIQRTRRTYVCYIFSSISYVSIFQIGIQNNLLYNICSTWHKSVAKYQTLLIQYKFYLHHQYRISNFSHVHFSLLSDGPSSQTAIFLKIRILIKPSNADNLSTMYSGNTLYNCKVNWKCKKQ